MNTLKIKYKSLMIFIFFPLTYDVLKFELFFFLGGWGFGLEGGGFRIVMTKRNLEILFLV
jgi:hypothetical protein